MSLRATRRDLVAAALACGAAGLCGGWPALAAADGPPETTTVGLPYDPAICLAQMYIARELLRAEGFTDVR